MISLSPVVDISKIRAEFPVLSRIINGQPLAYLDNASTSQKPEAVIQAMDRFYRTQNANIHRGVHQLSQEATQAYDLAREKVRDLLQANDAREIVFTKGCTEAINLVAFGLSTTLLKPGDEILVTTMEHHSNIVPWQMAAERTGAVVKPIPITDEGEVDMEAYASMLSERTKVVAMVHVSNSLGTINPVKQMVAMAHNVGAKTLVDGAQAGPHLRVDVKDLDADFYTLSCHKHYAPTGVGVLYGKLEHLEALPAYQGGGDMIRTVRFSGSTYAPVPAKFEAGTPNVSGVIGVGASIDYLRDLGDRVSAEGGLDGAFRWIGEQEHQLTGYAQQRLREIDGLRITGTSPTKAAVVAFTLESAHPHDIGTVLDQHGIAIRAGHHCCMPLMERLGVSATARASFAFYNTLEEVDRLADAVILVKELFS